MRFVRDFVFGCGRLNLPQCMYNCMIMYNTLCLFDMVFNTHIYIYNYLIISPRINVYTHITVLMIAVTYINKHL